MGLKPVPGYCDDCGAYIAPGYTHAVRCPQYPKEDNYKAPGEPEMLRTHSVCENEGDHWIPFIPGFYKPRKVHAILFEDGSVWDAVNGWRRK